MTETAITESTGAGSGTSVGFSIELELDGALDAVRALGFSEVCALEPELELIASLVLEPFDDAEKPCMEAEPDAATTLLEELEKPDSPHAHKPNMMSISNKAKIKIAAWVIFDLFTALFCSIIFNILSIGDHTITS